jgi:hypothetical protein
MIKKVEYKENGVRLSFHGIITSKEIVNANTELLNHHFLFFMQKNRSGSVVD